MSTIALLAQDLDDRQLPLTSFGNEPLWLTVGKALFVFVLLVLMTLFSIVFERKVVARMQQRSGPNRVGPGGWGQSLADGLTLPLVVAELPDRVVWVPMRTADAAVRRDLAVAPGTTAGGAGA